MANRVVIDSNGIKVSKPGQNVLTATNQNLIFDSSKVRTGQIYAGGTNLNLGDSSSNFLTTSSKSNLGYIPLVAISEKNNGSFDFSSGEGSVSNISSWLFTSSEIQPVSFNPVAPSPGSTGTGTMDATHITENRSYSGISSANENATNVNYVVLRIPCAYGYMTSSYFG